MAQFHFHPDGIVYVRAVGGVYVDTPENFLLDYGTTPPALPHGVAQALYDDSEQVLQFFDAKNNQLGVGQKGAWPIADAAIANIAGIFAAQAKRMAPNATPLTPSNTIKKASP